MIGACLRYRAGLENVKLNKGNCIQNGLRRPEGRAVIHYWHHHSMSQTPRGSDHILYSPKKVSLLPEQEEDFLLA